MTCPDSVAGLKGQPYAEVDLVDSGLLWLINTSVLWPRGFALAVNPSDGKTYLVGDGKEPIRTVDNVMQEKFEQVEMLFAMMKKGGDD